MRFELTTTDLEGRNTPSYAIVMSKMILNLPTFHWRRTLLRSHLAEQTGVIYSIIWLICKRELYKNDQFTEICR